MCETRHGSKIERRPLKIPAQSGELHLATTCRELLQCSIRAFQLLDLQARSGLRGEEAIALVRVPELHLLAEQALAVLHRPLARGLRRTPGFSEPSRDEWTTRQRLVPMNSV